jgi:hypothetical protein
MKENNKRPDILSDHALERVMRDVFSGFWSPRLNDPDPTAATQPVNAESESQSGRDVGLSSLQLEAIKPGS